MDWQATFQPLSKSDLTGWLANLPILQAISACKLSGMRRYSSLSMGGVVLPCRTYANMMVCYLPSFDRFT